MRQNGLIHEGPIYQRLAGLLEDMIQSRSLRVGDRMPSVRQFSSQQRVSVPTALQAYVTLETRGLIEARPKSGFYVRPRFADSTPEPVKFSIAPKITAVGNPDPVEALLADHANSKLVPLGAALPSADLLPGIKLTRTMAAIGRKLGANSIDYDMTPGSEILRRELARRSLEWGCALKADDFIVTVGATEALSLALRVTCKPGDTVVVESPTYFGLATMLRELQLNALPIPVNCTDGMDLDILEKALRKTRVATCVSIPNFHNPIGFAMPDERKRRLIELCVKRDIPLIEDDTYADLQHEGARPRCLKAFDEKDSVILCGSYSKKLAPGFRIGYIAAGKWHSRVKALKQASTLNGALLPTLAVAEFLKNGGYDRYLRTVRMAYRNQVAKMKEAVVESFPEGICLSRPKGGYLLWCELPSKVLRGHLRLFLTIDFGQFMVTRLIASFLQVNPDVTAELGYNNRPLHMIQEGCDAGIILGDIADDSVVARPAGTVLRCLVAAPSLVKTRPPVKEPNDLKSWPWLIISSPQFDGTNKFTLYSSDHREHSFRVSPVFVSEGASSLREAARAGLGVVAISYWLIREDILSGRLV